ncbi:hypothetical protein LIN78_07930 [Leeia sp. TBRC 13508]|uniref:Uncharacterized protein n=1 Tax=Leeia speluncae TaxID=2884804 RepID=A0ABS8D5I0_9NEIS|nr:hypothetical protein [Leeia speluncae]MCB6183474.1 hypothetical protein [Leeia speluncae]
MSRPPFAIPVPTHDAGTLDARVTKHWIDSLPVSNTQVMQVELMAYLRMVNDARVDHRERLKILEVIREHLIAVQAVETAKLKFRPLPFSRELQQQFELVCETWQSFVQGYLIVVDAALKGDEGAKEFAVFAAQRAMYGLSRWFICFFYAYRKVPLIGWQALKDIFFPMLALDWVDRKVKDNELPGGGSISLRQMFAHLILLTQCSPHKLSAKQLAFVDELLFILRDKLRCVNEAPLESKYPPIIVDGEKPHLMSSPHLVSDAHSSLLYIERDPIMASLARRVKALRSGEAWDIPELSDRLISAGGVNLLTTLYRHWSERRDRGLPRHGTSQEIGVSGDWPVCFTYLTGISFEKYWSSMQIRASQESDYQLFGKRETQTYHFKEQLAPERPSLEVWQLKDENEGGIGVLGQETAQHWQQLQLVLVNKVRSEQPSLGVVRRLLFDDDGLIELGVSLFQGQPQGVGVEPMGVMTLTTHGQPGIYIPAVTEALQLEMLLVPSGCLLEGRNVKLYFDEGIRQVKLEHLEIRGFNFDAFQITPAD